MRGAFEGCDSHNPSLYHQRTRNDDPQLSKGRFEQLHERLFGKWPLTEASNVLFETGRRPFHSSRHFLVPTKNKNLTLGRYVLGQMYPAQGLHSSRYGILNVLPGDSLNQSWIWIGSTIIFTVRGGKCSISFLFSVVESNNDCFLKNNGILMQIFVGNTILVD